MFGRRGPVKVHFVALEAKVVLLFVIIKSKQYKTQISSRYEGSLGHHVIIFDSHSIGFIED